MKKIRLSCAYAFPICKYGYPPSFKNFEKSLKEMAKMGYSHVEVEGLGWGYNRQFAKKRGEYQKLFSDLGLHIHNYCIVHPALISPNSTLRRKAYELYDIGCENAQSFGAETVHIATYTPPLRYEKTPYRLNEKYNFDLNYRVKIPRQFVWEQTWNILVESCRRASETADKYGLDVLVEPRVGEIIANSDSMLMLLRDVAHPRLKANFDFAHLMAQKETLALSWKKLEPHVGGIHVADNNTKDVEHLQIGKGKIDWEVMLKLIAGSDYSRYLGVDLFVPAGKAIRAFSEAKQRLEAMIHHFGLTKRFEISKS